MTVPRLAFFTIGVLKAPWGSAKVEAFVDRVEMVFASAEATPGFIARWDREDPLDEREKWGSYTAPSLYSETDPECVFSTLSLWEDMESVMAYSYRGTHGQLLDYRESWFVQNDLPGFVAWWVEDGHCPTFEEACAAWVSLRDNGPSPQGFDFRRSFDPQGEPTRFDRSRFIEIGEKVP